MSSPASRPIPLAWAVPCSMATACRITSPMTMQCGSIEIFPDSARVASSRSVIMARNWFTLRNTVSRCSRCSGMQLARQAIEHERDELVNAGQRSAQLVRNVRKKFVLELQLLAAAHIERSQQGLALDGIAHGTRQLFAVEIFL